MLTEAVLDEIVEGVAVTVVGELVVAGRKLLKALSSDGCEISLEFGEFCNDYGAASDRSIDERFLPHFLGFFWLMIFGLSSCYFEFWGFVFPSRSLAQSSFSLRRRKRRERGRDFRLETFSDRTFRGTF